MVWFEHSAGGPLLVVVVDPAYELREVGLDLTERQRRRLGQILLVVILRARSHFRPDGRCDASSEGALSLHQP